MNLIKDAESVASKFEAELRKLWNHEPKIAAVAATTIAFVGPILEAVFTAEAGPAAGAAAGLVIGKVQQDLLAANRLITVIGPTPSVKGLVLGAQQDLGELLTSAAIKNPSSVAKVTLVINELAALAGAFPPSAPTPPVLLPQPLPLESEVEPAPPVATPGETATESDPAAA